MSFHVGQKVECIATFCVVMLYPEICFPEKGRVYTVRNVLDLPGGIGLRLVEIKNELSDTRVGPFEPTFIDAAFRPITENKTDISIFKKLLNPSSPKVKEREGVE